MPYDSPTLAALARLIQYNSNAFNASTNPRGFSNGGHRSNFPASLTDSAIVANSLSATADNAATFIDEANAIAATIPTLASELQAGLVGLNLREYYVDGGAANDSQDGTTQAKAKKTITAGVALLQAGDVLWVKRSYRYRAETLMIPAGCYVISYGGGERAIIDYAAQVNNSDFSAVSGSANVYKITVNYTGLFPVAHPSGIANIFQQMYPTIFEGDPKDDPEGMLADGKRMRCVNGAFNFIFGWGDAGYTKSAGIAAVQAEPGSFFVMNGNDTTITTNGSGTIFDFYVHPPGSTNPITNGKEYSIASAKEEGWWQRNGGSCSGLWFARTGHKNGFQFDGVQCDDLKFSHYPLHGCFHNSCVIEDCESYALPRGGACFHGYRDLSVAPDRGLIYRRCKTKGGAWGFFAHSAGGAQAQLWTLFEDCETEDCVHPLSPDAVNGFIARRCKFLDARTVLSSNNGLHEDCFWRLHTRDEDSSIPVFGAGGILRGCVIEGGRAFRRAFQNVSSSFPLYVEKSTVDILDDLDVDSSSFVHLTDSVWALGFVLTATNSYTGGTLNHLGASPTNTGVTNCFSKRRIMSVPRVASGTMTAATIRVWPKDLTTYCIPDWLNGEFTHADNKITLYATTAADMALIKVGTPIWLYMDGQKPMDSGVYLVTAVSSDTQPRVTLDRKVVLPAPLATGVNYVPNSEGVGLTGTWFAEAAPMPRLELRLPLITQVASGFKITASGGTVFTADSNGFLPSTNNIFSSNCFRPTITFDPVVTGEDTGTATLDMLVNVHDLAPSWTYGPDGMRRLAGYLRDFGVGSQL
jgi:hypothetical protein